MKNEKYFKKIFKQPSLSESFRSFAVNFDNTDYPYFKRRDPKLISVHKNLNQINKHSISEDHRKLFNNSDNPGLQRILNDSFREVPYREDIDPKQLEINQKVIKDHVNDLIHLVSARKENFVIFTLKEYTDCPILCLESTKEWFLENDISYKIDGDFFCVIYNGEEIGRLNEKITFS